MKILDVLTGVVPPLVKKAARAQRQKDLRNTDEYRAQQRKIKNEKYQNDPEYREQCKQRQRELRAAATPEQRAADYQRRKAKEQTLTEEEFNRRRQLNVERQRRWREKKKAQNGAE